MANEYDDMLKGLPTAYRRDAWVMELLGTGDGLTFTRAAAADAEGVERLDLMLQAPSWHRRTARCIA